MKNFIGSVEIVQKIEGELKKMLHGTFREVEKSYAMIQKLFIHR